MKVPQSPKQEQYKSTCFANPLGRRTESGAEARCCELEFSWAAGLRAEVGTSVLQTQIQKVAVSFHCLPSRNSKKLGACSLRFSPSL